MKNLFLMAAILTYSIGIAQSKPASTSSSKPLRFGIKLGINVAKLTDSDDSSFDVSPRIGINVGGYLNYRFSDDFAFQPELLYTTQGIIFEGIAEATKVKITYKFDYITIPLMLKYYPNKYLNVEFGPQLAFNIKKEIEGKANGQTQSYDLDDYFQQNGIDAKTNTFDLGLNFGVGYIITKDLTLNARYTLGLTKVFEGADIVDSNGNEQSVKNSVFTFGLGYSFQ